MDQVTGVFFELAVVLGLSALVGYLLLRFRQPLLVAYLLVGVLLSAAGVFHIEGFQTLRLLPELGIALVLFFVGMELDLSAIRSLGKPILFGGLLQIVISSIAGATIAGWLGFPQAESIYLGLGLAFSSTIVVVKLLLEKKDLSSLYGKLSLGILLLEDLVAILVLMAMSVGSSFIHLGLQDSLPLVALLVKGVGLVAVALVSNYFLTKVFQAIARSAELLFLTALAWCFIFVSVAVLAGFSIVIGAFLAGVGLASSQFHLEIQGKVKPLRDFFVTLFFVYLGSQVNFGQIPQVGGLILAFTAYALVVKPLIFLLILGAFGFRKHTIFQTALNMSQVSEFSLIVLLVGVQLGVVDRPLLTAMALTAVLTIIVSSVMIYSSKYIYRVLAPFINFFEHGRFVHESENRPEVGELSRHVIVIGAHRVGGKIVEYLKREEIPLLVLDFNPQVVQALVKKGINVIYGDVGDLETLDQLQLEKASLIVSTAQDLEDNLMLLAELRKKRLAAVVIVRANEVAEARQLYQRGADFVLLPEVISGDFITQVFKDHWPNLDFFKDRASTELSRLDRNYLATSAT
ncbi:cation:proton antiporter [Candidatus Daviesbacteria bacterium]|nr:cation:proton antiporter [Candidatus Daviesbacteria bacterium]